MGSLGSKLLMFVLVNTILGSSLFYLPSLGVKELGWYSIFVWPILFFVGMLLVPRYAGLIQRFPSTGGTYDYTRRAFGRFPGFLGGWSLWLAGNLGMALNLVAAAEYFIPEAGSIVLLLRAGFVLLWLGVLNWFAYRGVDAGITMLATFSTLSIGVLLLMIIPSVPELNFSLLDAPVFVLPQILITLLLLSEAFFGFELLTYLGPDIKNLKDVPKIMYTSMSVVAVCVITYVLSSLAIVPFSDYVTNARPWALQAFLTMGKSGETIVTFGMYLVILGVAAAWPITSSRLVQKMAKDGLFPSYFQKLHPVHKSPYRAVLFQTIVVGLFSLVIFRGYLVNWKDPYKTVYLMYALLGLIVIVFTLFASSKLLKRSYLFPLLFTTGILTVIVTWLLYDVTAFSIIMLTGSIFLVGVPLYLVVEAYRPGTHSGVMRRIEHMLPSMSLVSHIKHVPVNQHTVCINCNFKGAKVYDSALNHVNGSLPEGKFTQLIAINQLEHVKDITGYVFSINRMVQHGRLIFVDYLSYFGFIPNVSKLKIKEFHTLLRNDGWEIKVETKKQWFWTVQITLCQRGARQHQVKYLKQ